MQHPIGGAKINIQFQNLDGTLNTVGTTITETGKNNGAFLVSWTPNTIGVFYIRATYDGDNQYAPCVSKVVQVTTV